MEEDPQGDTCIMLLPWILLSWYDGNDNGPLIVWLPRVHVYNHCYIPEAVEESAT